MNLRYCGANIDGFGSMEKMPGLILHTSNRLEKLASRLAAVVKRPMQDLFQPEVIVVQSRGMASWVSLQLADATGICMNCDFPFPRAFIGEILALFFPETLEEPGRFQPETMAWKIYALLPSLARKKEFLRIREYIEKDDGLKRFQLAEKVAHLFDQYMVYRPEMILEWERNPAGKEWQAILWRELTGGKSHPHIAAIYEQVDSRMRSLPEGGSLPERISIFGVSSLPPVYFSIFFGMARHCEVNLFSLDPSREYFGHDLSPRLRARLVARGGSEEATGNPLLSSLGGLNRDFTELRLELDERAGFVTRDSGGEFVPPDGKKMLEVVQGDVLDALNRGDKETPPVDIQPDDDSIQVHVCHSPMREIEVLYDQILDLFNRHPDLRPRDIMVMAPDIEKYAPFIKSVFGYPEDETRYIAFSVADRKPLGDSPIVEALMELLALPGSRCTATQIFEILDRQPMRARFGFTDSEMEFVRRWIFETGIRWGIDGAHRAAFDVPPLEANTWRAGLQRLILGYTMKGENRAMFEGVVPYDDMEGNSAEVLGRFLAATDMIFEAVKNLPQERSLAAWAEVTGQLVSNFFTTHTSEEAADLRLVEKALDMLRQVASDLGDADKAVGFRPVRHFLGRLLGDTEQRGGFFTGGITFCSLRPMRGIPARVICLIGMDDGAFPRQKKTPAFDLMAREHKPGDRSSRDDDRYSFLEALISAREILYVSYLGRSAVDNSEMPPSPLVSELLDYLAQAFRFPAKQEAAEFITRHHRLHAFSPRYFDGNGRLFSYSKANENASRSLQSTIQAEDGFPEIIAAEPSPEMRNVGLPALIEYFTHPARYFMKHRLGIRYAGDEEALDDSEPFDLGALTQYQIKQQLVGDLLEGHLTEYGEIAAGGMLPLAGIGEARFESMREEAEAFSKSLQNQTGGLPREESLPIDLQIGGFTLSGRISSIHGGRMVQYRCASLKPKDWLRAWINHLAICASKNSGCDSVLAGEEEIITFLPVENAREISKNLLDIFWTGLTRPQPLFPASSMAFAEAEVSASGRSRPSPIERARQKWNGNDFNMSGEKYDPCNAYLFGTSDPLDAAFERLAREVFVPMLRHVGKP